MATEKFNDVTKISRFPLYLTHCQPDVLRFVCVCLSLFLILMNDGDFEFGIVDIVG
jgi:hypothetical protein